MGKALAAKRDVREHNYVEQFPLGAKVELDAVHFDTGGGATNAAVTFARQGFRTHFIGKLGHDAAGNEVLRVLHREGVATGQVVYDPTANTSYSAILNAPNGERTILNYRGASHNLKTRDVHLASLKGDWLYLSSLVGNFDLLGKLLKHAATNGTKVAFNPGAAELAKPKKLRKFIPQLEVLMANREELQMVFGGSDATEIMLNALGICPYVVMTDGPRGTLVAHDQHIYHAGIYQKVKVTDRTGAGDAFCSGFVAALAQGGGIPEALTLGSANATSVVQKLGAKTGILHQMRLRNMKVTKVSI